MNMSPFAPFLANLGNSALTFTNSPNWTISGDPTTPNSPQVGPRWAPWARTPPATFEGCEHVTVHRPVLW